jgi:hypothetical protein
MNVVRYFELMAKLEHRIQTTEHDVSDRLWEKSSWIFWAIAKDPTKCERSCEMEILRSA